MTMQQATVSSTTPTVPPPQPPPSNVGNEAPTQVTTSDATNGGVMLPNTIIDPNDPNGSSKEKTPMCLINELARFNKVMFLYIYFLSKHMFILGKSCLIVINFYLQHFFTYKSKLSLEIVH